MALSLTRMLVCCVLILAAPRCWAEEPTLARLSFLVPPDRMVEFERAFQQKVVPIVRRHGLAQPAKRRPPAAPSIFSRLYEVSDDFNARGTRQALLGDPEWQTVKRELRAKFGIADRWWWWLFVYQGPAGAGRTVPAGPGKTVPAGKGKGLWTTFDATDGMTSGATVAILQDREGYLWFGGRFGLCRYDGREFTSYTEKDVLGHHDVRSILQDPDGDMWFGTDGGGITRFDPSASPGQAALTTFTVANGLTDNVAQLIFQDRSGTFWCQSDYDVQQFDGEKWTTVNSEGSGLVWVRSIFQDRSGQMWFGGRAGIVARYDGKTWTSFPIADGAPGHSVMSIVQDRSDNLWFSTLGSGAYRFDGQQFARFTTEDGLADNVVTSILEDRDGVLWFGTASGVSRYDPRIKSPSSELGTGSAGSGQAAWTSLTQEDGLSDNRVWSVFQDRSGQMWFGTQTGVCRYSGQVMTTLTTQDGLAGNQILAGLRDREGALWFSVLNRGVVRYDPGLRHTGTGGETFTSYTTEDGLISNIVYGIFQDRSGTFWFAADGGISRYDGETFTSFTNEDGLMTNRAQRVKQVLQDQSGKWWFVQDFGGVVCYDGETFTHFRQENIGGPHCNTIYQDREGVLWFGTWNYGVTRYDGGQFTRFTPEDGLANDRVWSILQDRSGDMWFGTTKGVSRYDGKAFINIVEADGLEDSKVLCIFEDRDGHLWFGTEGAGVYRYDGRTFQRLTQADGLGGNAITGILQDLEGRFWFCTSGGITRFDPSEPLPPTVVIDAVVADRRYEKVSALAVQTGLGLVTFEFHGLSFKTRPDGMVYRYRLKDHDRDWQTTHRRRVEYQDLQRGSYTFEVQAVDRDLVYSEAPATVGLTVHLPYERIGWISALSIFVLLIVWQTVRVIRRDRRLQVANTELFGLNRELEVAKDNAETANRTKSRFLANMSHELRTPLNGILGYAQILTRDKSLGEMQKDGVGVIRQSGEHLLSLINDILDLARIEADKVDLEEEEIRLPAFLKSIAAMTAVRVQDKGLSFAFHADAALPEVVVGDARRLRQVLLNLLGNAVKFTERGEVALRVEVRGRKDGRAQLCFEVIDTGIGMSAENLAEIFTPFEQVGASGKQAEGTGLGLTICRQLVGMMGSEIRVESSAGEGSRFWFELDLPEMSSGPETTTQTEELPIGFQGERKVVLVVDDKEENRSVLMGLLGPLGFDVVEAENGQAGLEKARELAPDLILMDLVMPVLDGFEAVRRLRQEPEFQNVVVIALSASVFAQSRQESLDAGCDDFLPKPVQAEDLLKKIGRHLDLEWIYETEPEGDSQPEERPLVAPPADTLTPIFELAQKGQIFAIGEQIDRIEQLGEAYRPFAAEIRKLARDFQVDQIRDLIQPYLEGRDAE